MLKNIAGQCRADCRGKNNRQPDHPHGGSAFFPGEEGKNHVGQQRHDDPCACSLNHPAGQQYREAGGYCRDNRSSQKHEHGRLEQLTGREPLHQKRCNRDQHPVDQHISRCQPLRGRGGNAKIIHQSRNGYTHYGLVQCRQKCAQNHYE
ncbi:hypothetical protein D3C73_1177260 [compost metagenome]